MPIPKPASSSRASSTDMILTNSLLRTPSISRIKCTATSIPVSLWKRSLLISSKSSSEKDWGVEILTGRPRKSDRAVEAAPIIWFISSHTALIVSSLSSNSSSGISVPISSSTIAFTSLRFSSIILLPSRPETYLISTPMAGSSSPRVNSLMGTTVTFGVVISTR